MVCTGQVPQAEDLHCFGGKHPRHGTSIVELRRMVMIVVGRYPGLKAPMVEEGGDGGSQ